MVKNRIFYIIALIGLILFYIYCNSYITVVILILFLVLTVFGIVSMFLVQKKILLEIVPTHRFINQSVDTKCEFYAKITNNSILPISAMTFDIEFRDVSEPDIIKRRIKTAVAAKEERCIYVLTSTSHSAMIEGKIKKAKVYDAFGIVHLKLKNIKDSSNITVMPIMSPESFLSPQKNAYIIDSDKFSDTQKGDDSSQVFEVREYIEGDDIRRIHWGLSSKYENLIVKEYSKPINEECVVLLETGLGSESSEECKKRTDSLLSVFMKLSYELINSEQTFLVYWYSEKNANFVVFDVRTYENIPPIIERFLSQTLTPQKNKSLYISEEKLDLSYDKQVYYLYNSSYCDNKKINSLGENYLSIDTLIKYEEDIEILL